MSDLEQFQKKADRYEFAVRAGRRVAHAMYHAWLAAWDEEAKAAKEAGLYAKSTYYRDIANAMKTRAQDANAVGRVFEFVSPRGCASDEEYVAWCLGDWTP